jgi:HNH endonuclease
MSPELRIQYLDLRTRLFAKTQGRCWYCGKTPEHQSDMTLDHVVPRAKGGGECETNFVAACGRCNGSKGNRSLEEYRIWLARMVAGWPNFKARELEWLRANTILPEIPTLIFYGEAPLERREEIAATMGTFWDRRYLRSSSIPPTLSFDRLRSHAQS